MPGQVYCFNSYNEPVNALTINGFSAGTVPGWEKTGAQIYTPSSVPIERVRNGSGMTTPQFPNDIAVPIVIDWDSFTARTSIDLKNLTRKNVSLDDDLVLYLYVNGYTLMSARGFVLKTQRYMPSGKSPAADVEIASFAAGEEGDGADGA